MTHMESRTVPAPTWYHDRDPLPERPPERGIFCNRTLNLRSTKAIGYDMDYTLIQYRVEEWERRTYEHVKRKLSDEGWPVGHLDFVGRPDGYDALAAYHDGLAFEHALAVHRNDRHVDESNDIVFIRCRRGGPG